MRILGIVLIVIGIVALILGGIDYTRREKVLDIGPVQATVDREHHIEIRPIIGIASLVAGVVLVVASAKTRA